MDPRGDHGRACNPPEGRPDQAQASRATGRARVGASTPDHHRPETHTTPVIINVRGRLRSRKSRLKEMLLDGVPVTAFCVAGRKSTTGPAIHWAAASPTEGAHLSQPLPTSLASEQLITDCPRSRDPSLDLPPSLLAGRVSEADLVRAGGSAIDVALYTNAARVSFVRHRQTPTRRGLSREAHVRICGGRRVRFPPVRRTDGRTWGETDGH